VTIVDDPNRTVSEGEKISMKYLVTLDHPIAKINVKLSTRISYIKVICLFNRYLSYKNFF
jgi:hypothetical protein